MKPIDARDRSTLIASLTGNAAPEYLFFWGHRIPRDGSITKNCLSQWYPSPFKLGGISYLTAEHFMMAAKARLFGDEATEQKIVTCPDPDSAKRLGRKVKNFDEAVWKMHRFEFVTQGNHAKFSQNRGLADFLKASSSRILVEASPLDRIWGIGLAHDHPDAPAPERWPGLNLLGFALMEVRATLC